MMTLGQEDKIEQHGRQVHLKILKCIQLERWTFLGIPWVQDYGFVPEAVPTEGGRCSNIGWTFCRFCALAWKCCERQSIGIIGWSSVQNWCTKKTDLGMVFSPMLRIATQPRYWYSFKSIHWLVQDWCLPKELTMAIAMLLGRMRVLWFSCDFASLKTQCLELPIIQCQQKYRRESPTHLWIWEHAPWGQFSLILLFAWLGSSMY